MDCLCTTYEVNQSKWDGAMEWKRQNLQTTCVTLSFDLLTQKWCAKHRHLMGGVCTIYEVNWSKRDGAWSGHGKIFKRPVWPWPFDLLTGNGACHIVTPWVVCVTHMKLIGHKGTGPREWTRQNLWTTCGTLTFDLLTQKWFATLRNDMGCMCTTHKLNRSKRGGATKQTRKQLWTTQVTLTFGFDTEMVRDTSSPHGLCVYHIGSESVKKWWSPRVDTAKPSNEPCDLDFRLLTQKWCGTHRHLMGCLCTTYEVNQSKRDGATDQTRQNLPTTPCDLDLWLFDPEMVRDTWPLHIHGARSSICVAYSPRAGCEQRDPMA